MAIYAATSLGVNGLPTRQEEVKVIIETADRLDARVAFRARSVAELVERDGRVMITSANVSNQIPVSLG